MAEIGRDIDKAAELLSRSELVAIPTETVYGLAGNALDIEAVSKIFEAKNRPSFDPLIVHSSSIEQVGDYAEGISDLVNDLADRFWPGPMTIILKKKNKIPHLVTSGLDTVAIRIPNHPIALELLRTLDFPLAAPSANPFGYVSPTTADHVDQQLGNRLAYILDGGPCQVGIESTIISFADEVPTILRLGGCEVEEIEQVIGKVKIVTRSGSNPLAPGMLDSHYAPLTPLVLGDIENLLPKYLERKVGILSFDEQYNMIDQSRQFRLSETSDLKEAAANLFVGLRYLDNLDLDVILSNHVPDEGLGKAINDRLIRAESKRN